MFCYPALMVVSLRCRGLCGSLGEKGVLGGHPKTQRTESCFYRANRTIEGPRNALPPHTHAYMYTHVKMSQSMY